MMNTITKGDVVVLAIASALAKRGERILMPFSQSEGYDLALDRKGGLFRIQCKSGRLRGGSVVFNTASHGPRAERRIYSGEVDAFGVYCGELDKCYLVPIEAVATRNCAMLRVAPPQINNKTHRFAADYIL